MIEQQPTLHGNIIASLSNQTLEALAYLFKVSDSTTLSLSDNVSSYIITKVLLTSKKH
jgi:hypothetical protein